MSNIDTLIRQAVFGGEEERRTARQAVYTLAEERDICPHSIQALYDAMGRGEVTGFTVPAMNLRGMTYDMARAVIRAVKRLDVGPFIFEIARSEIGYTQQRPEEYAVACLAACIKEGYTGPVFIQGDHFQAKAKAYGVNREKEIGALKALIDEALAAKFYNIDVDTSTLVDLDKSTLEEQQRLNFEECAHLTAYIREHQPTEISVSVGGEIGEVGKKNSTPEELEAFMDVYLRLCHGPCLSKMSVQSGTAHGGVVLPDGSIADVKSDFETLRNLSRVAREKYGLSGAVQHGASTLPDEAFHHFPETATSEIHLATGFQNLILDHDSFPADLRAEMMDHLKREHGDEWKEGQTEEQFLYKTRKKVFGPFKKETWELDEEVKVAIFRDLEAKFAFLFEQLNVPGTRRVLEHYYI